MHLPKLDLKTKLLYLILLVVLIPLAGNFFWLQAFLRVSSQNFLIVLIFLLVSLGTFLIAILVSFFIEKEILDSQRNKTPAEKLSLDFVTMAAHELRTPLTSLKSYLAVFLEENKGVFNDEQKTFLNRIEISAKQLASLIESLLNISRIERGVFILEKESLDWMENVKQVVTGFSSEAVEQQLTLEFKEPKEDVGELYVDKLRINETLSNLLSNAIAYTRPGGKVIVWVECINDEVITHVQDTGQGIPKEALPKLFTKFFRVSGALESGSKGTGLGLYLSKAIVDMHHGRIWVESVLGKGSTFSFSLPKESAKIKE